MGILSGLLGNAAEIDTEKLEKDFEGVLIEDEEIERAFKVLRDIFVFTNKRFVLVDKQGMTAKKVDYHTIPYKAITRFSIETAGHFDTDSELKLWVSGTREPIVKELKKGTDIVGIQKTLAQHILK